MKKAVRVNQPNTLKAISVNEDELRVGNYIVLFGDENNPDLDDQFFTAATELESDFTKIDLVIEDFEHGMGKMQDGMGPDEDEPLGRVDWKTKKIDEFGVWVERVLSRRNKYVQYLETLINEGLIGTSSESIPGKVEIKSNGEITKWPLKRDTLTVTPAEPRMLTMNAMAAIKSLAIELPEQEAKPEAARSAAVVAESQGKTVAQAYSSSASTGTFSFTGLWDAGTDVKKPKSGKAAQEKSMTKKQIKALEAYAELNGVDNYEDLTEAQKEFALEAAGLQETEAAPVDVEAIANAAAEKAVQAFKEAQPAVNPAKAASIEVVVDEADRPFKSIGANLLAVKSFATEGEGYALKNYPRLKFLKATGASEGVPSDGGFLLDPTLSSEIIKPVHKQGPFSSLARRLPVGNNSNYGWINGIDETSRVAGSRWGGIRGYRLAEAATKTASKPAFRRINWELKKYAVVVVATDELLADASMFSEIVRQGAAEELNFMVNDDIMNGSGVAGPQGIMNSGALITVTRTTGSKILGDDISAMYNRMDLRGRSNAVWFIGNDSQPQLDNLFAVGSTAVLYPYASIGADGIQRLYGRPVVVSEFNPSLNTTGDILFADMSQYLMWEKNGIEEASSIHVYFLSDESAFRFVYRCDGKSSVASALTPYKGSTTTSPFVVLGSAT